MKSCNPLLPHHPKSKASAYLAAGRIYLLGSSFMLMGKAPLSYSEVSGLASLLDTSLHATFEWDNLSKLLNRLNLERNRSVGKAFHHVMLEDTSGTAVDTKSFRGKYVLVDFWASWCRPCRALNPKLKALYGKYKDRGFEMVSISMDADKTAWEKAILQDRLPWVQLRDEKGFEGELARHYDIYGVPVKTLLDKDGNVVGFDFSLAEIEEKLKAL